VTIAYAATHQQDGWRAEAAHLMALLYATRMLTLV